ncbi:hypothetical protein ZIOFF_031265 [Zingiber officinale]|uniref:ER membrane protein complex subunit 6 n=1 Tax=Zingiber officinale TaxID=94328 RepID=A0A8J5GEG9_ZINOF|nr:hypothetical protein ZIOFF_031265 [Zingiber officinale]
MTHVFRKPCLAKYSDFARPTFAFDRHCQVDLPFDLCLDSPRALPQIHPLLGMLCAHVYYTGSKEQQVNPCAQSCHRVKELTVSHVGNQQGFDQVIFIPFIMGYFSRAVNISLRVYISRTFLSIIGGVVAGIWGFTGLAGFIFYFLVMAAASLCLSAKAKFSVNKYFDSWNRILLDGAFGGLMNDNENSCLISGSLKFAVLTLYSYLPSSYLPTMPLQIFAQFDNLLY